MDLNEHDDLSSKRVAQSAHELDLNEILPCATSRHDLLTSAQASLLWPKFVEALELGAIDRGGLQDKCIVNLRNLQNVEIRFVGDLHAKRSRLEAILHYDNFEEKLRQGNGILVLLGDLVHREEKERADEIWSSFDVLFRMMQLKINYPKNVYSILGDHEYIKIGPGKHGLDQGAYFAWAMQSYFADVEFEGHDFLELYRKFIERSPLCAIADSCVAVHAGPAISIDSLDALRDLPHGDVDPIDFHQAVVELIFYRPQLHDLRNEGSFFGHDVVRFLDICGSPGAELLTGHLPLSREVDWRWPVEEKTTVIFAAGRDFGFARLENQQLSFVRVGRSDRAEDDKIINDRSLSAAQLIKLYDNIAGVEVQNDQNGAYVSISPDFDLQDLELLPDVRYRVFDPKNPLVFNLAGQVIKVVERRNLAAWLRSDFPKGFYIVGDERRYQVAQLLRNHGVIVGGADVSANGQRFSFGKDGIDSSESLEIIQYEIGKIEFMPLVEGISFSQAE